MATGIPAVRMQSHRVGQGAGHSGPYSLKDKPQGLGLGASPSSFLQAPRAPVSLPGGPDTAGPQALWPELRVISVMSALQPCHSSSSAPNVQGCLPSGPLGSLPGKLLFPPTGQWSAHHTGPLRASCLLGYQGHLLGAWAAFEGWGGCPGWLVCGRCPSKGSAKGVRVARNDNA